MLTLEKKKSRVRPPPPNNLPGTPAAILGGPRSGPSGMWDQTLRSWDAAIRTH